MNILKNIFHNPKTLLAVGAGFLGIAFIDVLGFTDATSILEMTWWGQSSVYAFLVMLGGLTIRFGVLPIGGWIFSLFKKK